MLMEQKQQFILQKERLIRLQDALLEAYPELYIKHDHALGDFQELASASLNECEIVCQLLLEVEERKTCYENTQTLNMDQQRYIDLLKQINSGSLGLSGRSVPGNKLSQRITNHQMKPQHNQQQYEKVTQIDKEIHLLKEQFSASKRAQSVHERGQRAPRRHNFMNQSLSVDRSQLQSRFDIRELQNSENKLNRTSRLVSPNTDKVDLHTYTKEELINMVMQFSENIGQENMQPSYMKKTLSSSMHTQHRSQMKQVTQLQQELKDIEKRHLFVIKDFNKIQEERNNLLRLRDLLQSKVTTMERQLDNISYSMMQLMEDNKSGEMSTIMGQLEDLKNSNKQRAQLINEKDFEIAQKDKEMSDMRRKLVEFKHPPKVDKSLQDALNYDYGLTRGPKVNLQRANKETQVDGAFVVGDQKFLMEKYESLRQEHQQIQSDSQSTSITMQEMKEQIVDIIYGIVELKKSVVTKFLNKACPSEDIKLETEADFKYYNTILKQIRMITDQNIEQCQSNVKKQGDDYYQRIQALNQFFNDSVDVTQFNQDQLVVLNSIQQLFQEIVENFNKFYMETQLEQSKMAQYSSKVKAMKNNLEKVMEASSDRTYQQLIQINQEQLNQIIKLKKYISKQNKENERNQSQERQSISNSVLMSPLKGLDRQALSPFRESIKAIRDDQMRNSILSQSISKSPQAFTDKKINYLNLKLQEAERNLERKVDDVKEKDFMVKNMQEEMERKNIQITNLQGFVDEMNQKLNKQSKYIEMLERNCRDTEQKYMIDTQKTLRQHEHLVQNLQYKEQELHQAKRHNSSLEQVTKENSSVQQSMNTLKSQYEREKKLVEDKVRELTELQSSSVSEKSLLRENHDLKQMNIELNKVVKEERMINEEGRGKTMQQMQLLKEKIMNIENGCAKELVHKLRCLRDDVQSKVDQQIQQRPNSQETVDQMIKEIAMKVNQIVKQRENLQNAVNVIQSEKQQMYQSIADSQKNPFRKNLLSTNIAGSINRNTGNPMDQSLPVCITTTSPQKMAKSQRMQSQKSIGGTQIMQMPENEESNLYEYLQAEIIALREKKDQIQTKNQQLQRQSEMQEQRINVLDLFANQDNVEIYTQLIQGVEEILACHNQKNLLDDIISQPLNDKKRKKENAVDQSSLCIQNDTQIIHQENSIRLMTDLEALLPLLVKSIQLVLMDKDKLIDELGSMERSREDFTQQRMMELEEFSKKENQDKKFLKKVEENYKQELVYLKTEKDQIITKSKDFSKNLQLLQKDNENKTNEIKQLKRELKSIKEQITITDERIRKDLKEQHDKDLESKVAKTRDEAYYKGRKEAAEEMTLENKKLREIIDQLRSEMSSKSKRVIELQFEIEELSKYKKRSVNEVEELYQKLNKERDGQRELQTKLDGLLQEVSYMLEIHGDQESDDYNTDVGTSQFRRLASERSKESTDEYQVNMTSDPNAYLTFNKKVPNLNLNNLKNNQQKEKQQLIVQQFLLDQKKKPFTTEEIPNSLTIPRFEEALQLSYEKNNPSLTSRTQTNENHIKGKDSIGEIMPRSPGIVMAKGSFIKPPMTQRGEKTHCSKQEQISRNTQSNSKINPMPQTKIVCGNVMDSSKTPKMSSSAQKRNSSQKRNVNNLEQEWLETQRFLDQWSLKLKQSQTYSTKEMIDFISQVKNKFREHEEVTAYERSKVSDSKTEISLLKEQLQDIKDQNFTLSEKVRLAHIQINRGSDMIQKLSECLDVLKQTQLHSLMCLDFYKDIEAYVQVNRYQNQTKEVEKHIDKVDELMQVHGLNFMDFDAEKVQLLVEQIGEYLTKKYIEKKVLGLQVDSECNKTDDDAEQEGDITIKVTKLKKRSQVQATQGGVSTRTQSEGRDALMVEAKSNRHLNCAGNVVSLKNEVNNKNQMIFKLREQLQTRIQKILVLKTELKKERDKSAQRRKHEKYKDSITKLEKEFNQQVLQNTKQQLDLSGIKLENEKLLQDKAQLKELYNQCKLEKQEFQKALKDKAGFSTLENTVAELSNLLVSRKNEDLTASQKFQLKAIFGNSSILHKLRTRIQELEDTSIKISHILTISMNINYQFQDTIEEQWSQLKQIYQAFRDIKEEDLNHYQLLILHNQLKDKWAEEKIDQYERDFAQKLVQLKEIRGGFQRDSVVSLMNRQIVEEDRHTLLSMALRDQPEFNKHKSVLMSNTPTKESFIGSIKQQALTSEKEPQTNVVRRFPVFNKMHSDKKLTSSFPTLKNEDSTVIFGGPSKQQETDFNQLFQFEKANSKQRLAEDSPRLRFNKDDDQELRLENLKKGKNAFRKISDPQSETKLNTLPLEGLQKLISKDIDFEIDSATLESQINDTNLINDLRSNNGSVTRQGGPLKKLLRNKLKRYREENASLRATLQQMQQKMYGSRAQGIAVQGETDLSLQSNQLSSNNMPGHSTFTLLNDISSGQAMTPKHFQQLFNSRQYKEDISIKQSDALVMLQVQAQALEALIKGDE